MSESVRLLRRSDVEACLDREDVIAAVRSALVASAHGRVHAPVPLSFDFPAHRGEAHIKGAHVGEERHWTLKMATGFYGNPTRGLPTASGMSLVSSAETGLVETIILDGGHLTDVRTGAAGSIAADLLAPTQVNQVGIVGCGIQARIQLEYLLVQRRPARVVVFGRRSDEARRYATEMNQRWGVDVGIAETGRDAVAGSELVITTTPAEEPVVRGEWVTGPIAIVAVGSDMPSKHELAVEILERAELVLADDPAQAARVGELHHSPEAADRASALGDLIGKEVPRAEIAVADLTGLGAEDACVASLVAGRAEELGLGEQIEIS